MMARRKGLGKGSFNAATGAPGTLYCEKHLARTNTLFTRLHSMIVRTFWPRQGDPHVRRALCQPKSSETFMEFPEIASAIKKRLCFKQTLALSLLTFNGGRNFFQVELKRPK